MAALVRLAFWNGPFGSDDLVYLDRAIEISRSVWSSSNYNGALRYGFNIPAGMFVRAFGISDVTVNLWPLVCSLGEIVVVYAVAHAAFGSRAALFSSIVLAFTPLHVAVATRIHADPVVSFFLSLSFALLFFAERTRSTRLYWLTGMAMGAVFWTKELAVATLLAFAAYPAVVRRLDVRWCYVVAGGVAMLAGHLLLMTAIAGDPFHVFKVVLDATNRSFVQEGLGEDGAWYYFRYLFIDIRHTWLAPLLALVAIAYLVRHPVPRSNAEPASRYIIFWLVSLVCVLSFLPVSLSPLRLAMKQSNYLTLFLAPIAILAGFVIARIPRPIGHGLLAVTATGGLVLAAMEQQAYRVFTSNSKAIATFAQEHPGAVIYGSVNNANIARVVSSMTGDRALRTRVRVLSEADNRDSNPDPAASTEIFAAIDRETMAWGKGALVMEKAPNCWTSAQPIVPTGFGLGRDVSVGLRDVAGKLPGSIGARAALVLGRLADPAPAELYRVDGPFLWCKPA
ncbi:MAG: glycosyltransferase family 39 protein [Bryobacteraceae bacterium]